MAYDDLPDPSRRTFLAGLAALLAPGALVCLPPAPAWADEPWPAGIDAPNRAFWPAEAQRLLMSMARGGTVLAANVDKDAPLRRTSPIDPQRSIAGRSRPHFGTDYSSRDETGAVHASRCLYAPFDGTVLAAGDMRDGRGEYMALRSDQRDASLGMVVTHYHMSSQFAPMAGRTRDGRVEYHAGVHVRRGQCIGLIGDTGWDAGGKKISTGIHDDVRGYLTVADYRAKRPFDYHPVNQLAWRLSRPEDYWVLQGRYAHHVDRERAMAFFASLPRTEAVLATALDGAPELVRAWYAEFQQTQGGR